MKILNLVNREESQINYSPVTYPDGQRDIIITSSPLSLCSDSVGKNIYKFDNINIKSRMNNMEDLGMIICAVTALRRIGNMKINLFIPYLLGARSDRQFTVGGNSYLVDIIAPLLNNLNLNCINCLDTHNVAVAQACIKNLVVTDNTEFVRWAIKTTYSDNFLLLSPDTGAMKKVEFVAENIGYRDDIIVCRKTRSVSGKLSNTVVPDFDINKDIIVIDDICDAGKTFINISGALNDAGHTGKKYLVVTHGIFSKGFKELERYFDGIFTTNSVGILSNNSNVFDASNVKLLNTLNIW